MIKFVPIYFSGLKSIIFLSPALLIPFIILGDRIYKNSINRRFLLPFTMFLFLILQWLILGIDAYNEFARLLPPLFLFAVAPYFIKSSDKIISVVCYIVVIDTLYRLAIHPSMLLFNPFSDKIYSVKNTASPFFFDSNLTALYALFTLTHVRNISHKLILIVCIYLTFSRSVYFMAIFYYLVLQLPFVKLRLRVILGILVFLLFMLIIDNLFQFIASDGSGRTKLLILENARIFLSDSWLIGIGSGEFKNNFILASHTLVGQLAELGVSGFILVIYPLLYYTFSEVPKSVYSLCVTIIVGGTFGLFPIAYIGWLYILLENGKRHHVELYERSSFTRLPTGTDL
jgi:hypothetical protein